MLESLESGWLNECWLTDFSAERPLWHDRTRGKYEDRAGVEGWRGSQTLLFLVSSGQGTSSYNTGRDQRRDQRVLPWVPPSQPWARPCCRCMHAHLAFCCAAGFCPMVLIQFHSAGPPSGAFLSALPKMDLLHNARSRTHSSSRMTGNGVKLKVTGCILLQQEAADQWRKGCWQGGGNTPPDFLSPL